MEIAEILALLGKGGYGLAAGAIAVAIHFYREARQAQRQLNNELRRQISDYRSAGRLVKRQNDLVETVMSRRGRRDEDDGESGESEADEGA